MKTFLLKVLNVILTVVMIISVLYAVFNLVMMCLPTEIQSSVYNWLRMSEEYIATFSISSVFNAVILVGSKLLQTYTKVNLSTELAHAKTVINQSKEVNNIVIERANNIITNTKVLQEQLNALLTVQKVNVERNIKASDKLVYKSEKEAYKQAIETIDKAQQELEKLKNITSVYEKTEIKEIIVEKEPKDQLTGRV